LLRRSESVDDDLPEALVGWAVRDLVTAEERLRAFVARVPRDPFARHLLGATQLARGSVQEAVGTLESLISDDSDFTPALNHLGAAYLALGEVDRGLATLRHFVERDPGNASARDSLAGALEQAGDREAAIGQLTRALLLDPSFAYAWLHLGEILEQLGETDLAARAYRTARDAPGAYGAAFVDVAEKNLARLGRDGDPQ